jgi:hypothetical protein
MPDKSYKITSTGENDQVCHVKPQTNTTKAKLTMNNNRVTTTATVISVPVPLTRIATTIPTSMPHPPTDLNSDGSKYHNDGQGGAKYTPPSGSGTSSGKK